MGNMEIIYFILALGISSSAVDLSDYKHHPCIRECGTNTPMTCEYDFTLEYYYTLSKACYDCPFNKTDCSRPHCVPADGMSRAILTVNRMLPGPAIHVCLGDTVVVNVKNQLEGGEGTSIHWHGVHLSPFMDGVAMITQCPISTHSSYQYRFQAINPGTHYWHSHSGVQNSDGIFGAFVIREPKQQDVHLGRYDVDTPEFTVIVNDWMSELTASRLTNNYHNGANDKPSSMLFNGKGAFEKLTKGNTTAYTEYEVFNVQPGRRYRFRFISNALNNCPILLSVDNHNLTIIASDGAPVEPVTVDSLYLFSGERFDVVIHTNQPNMSSGNYWIRASGNNHGVTKHAYQLAILRYEGAADAEPVGDKAWNLDIPGTQLNPVNVDKSNSKIYVSELNSINSTSVLPDPALKAVPDKTIHLAMDFNYVDNYRIHHPDLYSLSQVGARYQVRSQQINHISTILPPAPLQSQYSDVPKDLFCNGDTVSANCTKEYCACLHVVQIGLGEVAEIVMVDEGKPFTSSHPFHLHGHYFRVVAMDKVNSSTTMEEVKALDASGKIKRNLDNPPVKDTVNIMDGGYTIIRLHAKNPGFWFFHCHWTFHNEMGMGMVLQIGNLNQQPNVPKNFPTCGPWKFDGYQEENEPTETVCPSNDAVRIKNGFSLVHMMYCFILVVSILL